MHHEKGDKNGWGEATETSESESGGVKLATWLENVGQCQWCPRVLTTKYCKYGFVLECDIICISSSPKPSFQWTDVGP